MRQSAAAALSEDFAHVHHLCRPEPSRELTHRGVRALQVIGLDGPATVADVAQSMGIAQNTASEMVGRLSAAGLVTKRRRADDERSVELALSAAGRQALRQHTGLDVARLTRALRRMSEGERAAVVEGLRLLRAHLEETT